MIKGKWFLLVVILIFSIHSIESQDNKERELQLRNQWNERTSEDFYNTFYKLFQKNDTLGMRVASEMMLTIATKSNDSEDFIRAYHRLSLNYQVRASYQKALETINQSISYLQGSLDFPNKLRLFLDQGRLYKIIGNYTKSLESYLIAENLLKGQDKIDEEVNVRYNIAAIKSLVYDVYDAIELFKKNIEIIENSQNSYIKEHYTSLITDSWVGIASAYTNVQDYESALEFCNKILKEGAAKEYTYGVTVAYLGYGSIYSLNGKYEKAFSALEKVEKIENRPLKDFFQIYINLYRARIYYRQNKINKSLVELQKIEQIINKQQLDFFLLQEVYVLFAKNYKELSQEELALNYFNRSLQVIKNDALRKSRINNNITERYDLAGFKNEIDTLSKKSETQKRLFWIVIIVSLFSIIIFWRSLKYIQKKNKKKFNTLLKQINAKQTRTKSVSSEDSKSKIILEDLEILEEKLFFLNIDITQYGLAKKLNTNTTYLSKIINQNKHQSFSDYITNLRIKYSIERLQADKQFRRYSVVAISKESGFKSMTPFVKAFKSATGLYPSYFIKQLNQHDIKDS